MKSSEQFVPGKNNIGWVGPNFKDSFYGSTFTMGKNTLESKNLPRIMNNKEILAELKPRAVGLEDVLHALTYLDKSGWYIFYVNDKKGILWAVGARWDAGRGGWHVGADSVGNPNGWGGDCQVLSREFGTEILKTKTLSNFDSVPLELKINGFTYRRI